MADGNITLSDLSREQLPVAIPSMAYLSILMAVGITGNVLVVIVFGFRLKKASTYRHFILVLAVYDLMACCVGMPGLIFEMGTPYLFTSGVACKVLRYGYHMIGAGTSLTHALVGVDRYRRICKVTHTQISVHSARSLSYCMLIAALVIAMPTIFIHDTVMVETRVHNISGYKCGISSQYEDKLFPLFYEALLTVLVISVVLTLAVLYTCIGRTLCHRMEFLNSITRGKEHPTICHDVNGLNVINSATQVNHHFENRIAPWQPRTTEMSEQGNSTPSVVHDHESLHLPDFGVSVVQARERSKSASFRRTQNQERLSRKVTVTTFAIMAVYIGSFVPLQILQLVSLIHRDMSHHMTDAQEVFYHLGFLTYAIDNVANPIIYILMDQDFRNGCKDTVHSLRCK